MTSHENVHDSDLDDDDDDHDVFMTNELSCNKTLCCGSFHPRTCTPRGTFVELCQIITTALTSSDSRDSLDMPNIHKLLVGFECLSSNDIQKLSYFNDSRISLLEEYIERLILHLKSLKELPGSGIKLRDRGDSVFETAGDVLYAIPIFNWVNSKPQRCRRGVCGYDIRFTLNEVINCLNEIKLLRSHAQSSVVQEKLKKHLEQNWHTYQMCNDGICDKQKQYRKHVKTLNNTANTGRRFAKSANSSNTNMDSIVVTDLLILVSPPNSGDNPMDIVRENMNSKRSRLTIGFGMKV